MTDRTPVLGTLRGAQVVRHFGDPAGEWAAATTGAALRDRSHRRRWQISGRQPSTMLQGIVTGQMPGVWAADEGGRVGRAEYSVVLTPKGRTVADLRLWRATGEPGEAAPLFVEVSAAGAGALRDQLARVLPPRFARVEDRSDQTAMITVLGPDAASVLAATVFSGRVSPETLLGGREGDLRAVELEGLPAVVIRSGEISEPGWDVVGEAATIARLRDDLESAGVRPVGSGVWEALRLEAGRPAFGADLTAEHIPIEAGLGTRAIDHTKGCYTGQEVIVRIRDRGHVNRHLRRVRLGDGPLPSVGTELWWEEGGKVVGQLTSVGTSPREGALALGYVRREVEPPASLRLGDAEGARVTVEALDD